MATPCLDDSQIPLNDHEIQGSLHAECSKIVLKFLWTARLTRPDIFWTVNLLAKNVTKWTKACDKRLFRLVCYVEHTKDVVQYCFVGDRPSQCKLILYADASFAADIKDSKSTTSASTRQDIAWLLDEERHQMNANRTRGQVLPNNLLFPPNLHA